MLDAAAAPPGAKKQKRRRRQDGKMLFIARMQFHWTLKTACDLGVPALDHAEKWFSIDSVRFNSNELFFKRRNAIFHTD